jgi:hydroxymethylbilane synthase
MPREGTRILRIATRHSPLAMWQAEHVAELLAAHGIETELVPLVSGGDIDMRPIDGSRQMGVFTKRIQQALIDDEADIAVHSLKDLPTAVDARFTLTAVPTRETVHDCLLAKMPHDLDDLPRGARIGTGSRRRAAQLLSLRADLDIQPIRGNVQTRLAKLEAGEFDAIILAKAGLVRLEMTEIPHVTLSLEQMLPAPGQGALGIETRSDDVEATKAVASIDHADTRAAVTAERTLLANLHGGCLAPIAALGKVTEQLLTLDALVLASDGSIRLAETGSIALTSDIEAADVSARDLANQVSARLIEAGARELIEQAR